MRTSAMGREQPIVTLREFFALATCYAGSTGRLRQKPDVRPDSWFNYITMLKIVHLLNENAVRVATKYAAAHSFLSPTSRLRRNSLTHCCAIALLMFSTSLLAAEPVSAIRFSERIYSSTGIFPSKLAVFADCVERPRIFGKVEQSLYQIDLPAGTSCTVRVGEWDWNSLPIAVEDAAVTVALPILVYPREVPEPTLARELVEMGKEDQALRGKRWRTNDPEFLNRVQADDGARQQRLAEIIAAKGWPALSMVGWEAANAAWLIAQHSPAARLKPWLFLMQEAAAKHEIAPYNLATSIDRVLVYDNRKQLYGTQYRTRADGGNEPYPSEDMDQLDHRRLRMGLPINVPAKAL